MAKRTHESIIKRNDITKESSGYDGIDMPVSYIYSTPKSRDNRIIDYLKHSILGIEFSMSK